MKQNQIIKHVQRQSISKLVTFAATASLFLLIVITIFQILQFIFIPQDHSIAQNVNASMIETETETGTKVFQYSDIISTRGNFDYHSTGQLIHSHNRTDYAHGSDLANNNNSKISNRLMCPPEKELAIYIHGIWVDEQAANEQFNRTAMSLAGNNSTIPLIGYSWDSNTPISKDGWETAKNIAEKNGPKLAQFVIDLKNKCRDTDIRFIAHSLGAEVVNSTLASLSSNQNWNERGGLNFASVHLLGAAIDRSSVAANTTFGKAIDNLVGAFYNLRNSEDNLLEYVYSYVEKRDALGLLGISHSMPLPKNYFEREVSSDIPSIQDVDGNGRLDCFDYFVILPGDNHCGYIGARGLSPFGNIPRNDGAIDIVVQDWSDQ